MLNKATNFDKVVGYDTQIIAMEKCEKTLMRTYSKC